MPLVRHFVDVVRRATTRRHAVRVVRGDRSATSTRSSPAAAGDEELARARRGRSRARTYELTEFLVDVLGVTDVGAYFPHRVTYHPTCHSLRMLRVGDQPLRLLRAVRGLTLVELPDAEVVLRVRRDVRGEERGHLGGDGRRQDGERPRPPAPRCCTAGDTSCLMHIGGGLSRLRSGVRTVHLAEILASTADQEVPA